MCFAEALLFLLLFVLPSPLLELCPAVLCHLRCCVCHICTVLAVVPGVSPCVCAVFFEVAVYFLLLLLLLWRCGSVLLWCFCVAGVLSWFRGVVGVSCVSRVACVLLLVCVVLCFFCLCWFWFVLLCPLFGGCCSLSVVLLLVCFSAPLFLLCVAPSWCWFMRFLLSWWFLVVIGPPPLFLVRHDQVRLWSCSWFNAECHPGWVAVWCFCSWRFMGVRLGVLSCSSRCLRTRRFCLVCVWFGFLLPVVFRLVLVSLVLLFLFVARSCLLGCTPLLARFFWFVLFLSLRLVVLLLSLLLCVLLVVAWFLWVML